MSTIPPGAEPATATDQNGKAEPDADRLDLSDIVNVYLQQNAAVNQLWAMYAATTFAAGVFALTVGNQHTPWLLFPGAAGFLAFTYGHWAMVENGLERMKRAAADIEAIRTISAAAAAPEQSLVEHLATRVVSIKWAKICHRAIDACVLAAFAGRLLVLLTAPEAVPAVSR
jgi:hypothetical protein